MKSDYMKWFSLILLLIKRDLKVRYRSSFLGYLWSMLNPLLFMIVMTFVFSHAMRVQMEHYPLYILSGLLCWNMFSQSANLGVNGIVNNASLLKKVSVPSWVFPTAVIGSACVHTCFAFVPYIIIAVATGFHFHLGIIQFPLVVLSFFLFVEGVVLVLSSLNVFFRDVGHVLEPILQLVFYMTPILYPISVIPEKYRFLLKINPITYYLDGFRSSLYIAEPLSLGAWGMMALLAAGSMTLGVFIFNRCKDRFLYYV